VFAEDTRVTAKLLAAHGITVSLAVYHQHSGSQAIQKAIQALRDGQDIALVSDAGTPGINDPGGKLVHEVVQAVPGAAVVPIPGANAALAALSVSGFPTDSFIYRGFVPHKKGRQTFWKNIAQEQGTQVFYESKHRIMRALSELGEVLSEVEQVARPLMVARELTKMHETLYRGSATEVRTLLEGDKVLGEFVVVIGPWRATSR
jgi:16S rRNA (cytidine1402-2'-O)-methyltransferase